MACCKNHCCESNRVSSNRHTRMQAVLDRPSTAVTCLPKEIRLEYGKARVAEMKYDSKNA